MDSLPLKAWEINVFTSSTCRRFLPWKRKEYIEQDLVICRALCVLYNDEYLSEHLALRGGTTLNKIYLNPQPRFSEDNIDAKNIIRCYREYIGFVTDNPPTKREYLQNMELKLKDEEFLGDIEMLLRPEEKYNPQEAWELVKREIVEKL